ncbi:hypothetical protein [Echinococcus multilocularis]|uniref:Uncharacterized protein n=1 Tax=Echinococcus multilocularis TaxID=6211 RepID=A0A068Y5Q4_ECHMU|nr:hypothetical protein [Echinococcus multilocularis]
MQCAPVNGESLLLLGSDGRLRLLSLSSFSFMSLRSLPPTLVPPVVNGVGFTMLMKPQDPLALDFAVAPSPSASSSSLVVVLTENGGFRLLDLSNGMNDSRNNRGDKIDEDKGKNEVLKSSTSNDKSEQLLNPEKL